MRKWTLHHELMGLNGKEITMGHKYETTTWGRELRALNGKEITLGHKLENKLWVVSLGL